jgi:glutamyl-tRNA synthetase
VRARLLCQDSDPNSLNAQKKAAKKAAKKAQKGAGGGTADPPPAEGAAAALSSSPPPANGKPSAPKQAAGMIPAPVASKVAPTPALDVPSVVVGAGIAAAGNHLLAPLQCAINPNVPFAERPLVAMAVAVLSNTAVDLDVVSDHRRPHACALGMDVEDGGGTVVGDFAMARYLAARALKAPFTAPLVAAFMPASASESAIVDSWIDYASSIRRLDPDQKLRALAMSLEHALQDSTFLVGSSLSLADLCMFAAAGFPTQAPDRATLLRQLPPTAHAAKRWIKMLAYHPALQEATQLCVGVVYDAEADFGEPLDPLVSGMNTLEGAIPGRVVTRFPPEPSGYLHIGHAKAVLLNDYYAKRYKGRLLLRFDDTNPSKEKEEFQQSIVEDLAALGVRPDLVSYTSDYFDVMEGYAKVLMENGLAYMDDTPQEQMKIERGERQESKHRGQTPEEALKLFKVMCSGSTEGGAWCLRAKIDMKSDNGTMRDPVLYRQNLTPHHRSGTKYKAYPTYDLACPIVDSLEGVTHALRTTEYNDRDEQYQWILKALGLRRVRIHAFARVNFVNTVLSKRKLTWFVENGYVTGWDDARFPTVRGVVRRGVNITALRSFIYSQGASRRVVYMDWTVFWSENKKEIDKTARRFMAIDKDEHIKLVVSNAPKGDNYSYVETSLHPKDPSLGTRVVRLSNEVLLESVDVEGIQVGEDIVLLRWGVVKITKVEGGLEGEYTPDGNFKNAKRKLSWLANVPNNTPVVLTEFDNLVTKDKLDEEDKFEDYINPNTMATTDVIGDAGLKSLREHDVIQLERRGYYRVDRPYMSDDKPLILFTIPDGKSKAMSGKSGKLAHR